MFKVFLLRDWRNGSVVKKTYCSLKTQVEYSESESGLLITAYNSSLGVGGLIPLQVYVRATLTLHVPCPKTYIHIIKNKTDL